MVLACIPSASHSVVWLKGVPLYGTSLSLRHGVRKYRTVQCQSRMEYHRAIEYQEWAVRANDTSVLGVSGKCTQRYSSKMGKTTSVERMRKLREKLKEAKPNEYKIHLEKERQRDRKRRENMKRKETTSTRFMAARRLKETERKRKYRQKKKENSKTAYADAMELEPLLGSYSCVQSLGKASSGIKDTKTIKNPKTGERVLYQKRYMNMTVKEAYSLFVLENPDIKGYNKESLIVGRTFRSELSKFRVFKLDFSAIYPESDSGSAACETSLLDSSKGMVPIKAPTVADITAGSFLLVEFTTSKSKKTDISIKYRYAGIAQTSIEDDGEVKVMFLRNVGDSGNQFKTNEKDISFVTFDQILGILPTPEIKNVRNSIFYKFPAKHLGDRAFDVAEEEDNADDKKEDEGDKGEGLPQVPVRNMPPTQPPQHIQSRLKPVVMLSPVTYNGNAIFTIN
uniref:Uncharacterized protein n=1 Tax=Timema genevievae TaxID=629358 RepID=A0A7R9PJS9_TIMGE|nr:unnamed protein product [Timema genevievae]